MDPSSEQIFYVKLTKRQIEQLLQIVDGLRFQGTRQELLASMAVQEELNAALHAVVTPDELASTAVLEDESPPRPAH